MEKFACIYARPCLSGFISANAYKSYCLLCEIIELLIKPTFASEEIEEIFRLLNEHHQLFAKVYGKWEVTINYHMALHIPDVIYDFGPSHGYWCFAYERLSRFLSNIPNSNQNIELQIMNKFIQQFSLQVVDIDIDSATKGEVSIITKCSESESYTSFSDSLLLISNLLKPLEDGLQFQIKLDRGDVLNWPIELLHPSQLRVRVSDEFVVELQEHFRMLYSTEM